MALIPWWIRYPNVNDEIMNLDWLLRVSNENTEKISNFMNLNTIKYADPILWDITSQYEANTITVDPQTGDAYISTKAVPYGVSLSNTDYWTKIYNYADEINDLQEQIAAANEKLSTTATAPRAVGDLVWLNGLLYEVTAPMIAGDSYVVDSNCKKVTIEELLNLLQNNIDAEVDARTLADTTLQNNIDAEANTRALADTNLLNEINKLRVVKTYETVADMVADEDLTADEYVNTLGYHSAGIGAATYKISNEAGVAAITLDNGLKANIVVSDTIHLNQLGARENDDISNLLVDAITLINKNGSVHFDDKYEIASKIDIALGERNNITIDGHEHNVNFSNNNSSINFTVEGNFDRGINIINCDFYGNTKNDALTFTGFMSAVNKHEIKNCQFWGFKHAIFISNSRMFFIENIAVWDIPEDGEGVTLRAYSNGFVGDTEIVNSQFTAKNGSSGDSREIFLNVDDSSTCAGIVMDSNDFYPATYCIYNAGNGTINDIWITNCQFDGASAHSVKLVGNGALNNLSITNNYDTAPLDFITVYKPSGKCKALLVADNYINGYADASPAVNINCNNESSASVKNNHFINCINNGTGALIGLFNLRTCEAIGNIFDLDSGYSTASLIEINNCVNAICSENIGMNVSGTAYKDLNNTNKIFTNNLPT